MVVKKEIKHDDYVNVIETNEALKKEVVSIRSFNHQLYTFKQQKIALTSFYDNMQMIDNSNCITYGYNPKKNKSKFQMQHQTRNICSMTPRRCYLMQCLEV